MGAEALAAAPGTRLRLLLPPVACHCGSGGTWLVQLPRVGAHARHSMTQPHAPHTRTRTCPPARAPQVRPTGDARGNGAYATVLLPKGSWLCDYEGELIGNEEFDRRYPDGVVRSA